MKNMFRVRLQFLFIAESPPKAFIRNREAYFYSSGPERSNSIAYHIDQVLFKSKNKDEFFERFKDHGFYLIDMVKCPIGGLPESMKRRAIIKCVEYLKEELRELKFEKEVFIGKKTFNEIRDHLTLNFPHELLPLSFYNKTNVEKLREGVARVITASCGESPAYKPQR
jgi:hypothetical protein